MLCWITEENLGGEASISPSVSQASDLDSTEILAEISIVLIGSIIPPESF